MCPILLRGIAETLLEVPKELLEALVATFFCYLLDCNIRAGEQVKRLYKMAFPQRTVWRIYACGVLDFLRKPCRNTNLYLCTLAGGAGLRKSIVGTVEDLQPPVGIIDGDVRP